jgi:hypothetical protein
MVDYSDTNSSLLSDIKTLFAARSLEDTAIKIKSVLRMNASQGKIHGGALKPYGYTGDGSKMLTIDEEEAAVVKQIFSLYLSGNGTGKIAEILNSQGIFTKGRKYLKNGITFRNPKTKEVIRHIPQDEIIWVPHVILTIIRNPIYKGERRHMGETFTCPAIIDIATWDKAQNQRALNLNAPGLSKHNYLLKNLCVCGRCKSAFCGRTRLSKKDHYYRCASKVKKGEPCGIRSINIDTLDRVVWLLLNRNDIILDKAKQEVERLKNPVYLQELQKQKETLEIQIRVEAASKVDVVALLKKGLLEMDEAENLMRKSLERIKSSKESLSQIDLKLNSNFILSQKVDEFTESMQQFRKLASTTDFELKRTIINTFIEKVVIDFDDENELYTLNITLKLSDSRELHTYFVKNGRIKAFDSTEKVVYNGVVEPIPSFSYITNLGNTEQNKNDVKLNLSEYSVGFGGSKYYQLDAPQKEHSHITNSMVRRAEWPGSNQRISSRQLTGN